MDVFNLREAVVDEYRDYVESFINIYDERADAFVRERLAEGELWPDPALQLNPAYAPAETLGELYGQSVIREETASFFGHNLRLYQHQREALSAAQRGDNYVVTTGTGSGKSLTYLVPIYDAITREMQSGKSTRTGVRAVLVYPMNALINSQEEALKRYAKGFADNRVRFAQYTGQTDNDERNEIINNPPHILLTNYVMLELLLLRPTERPLLMSATRDLEFIVMDELHFYRGRQGADVGMLLRRLSRHASEDVRYIGTSATVASEGEREERNLAVAQVSEKLFGVEVSPENVIEETLVRITKVDAPQTRDELLSALAMNAPQTREQLERHPLAAWIEFTFGLSESEGRLVRPKPQTFEDAVQGLVERFGVSADECRRKLQAILDADTGARDDGEPDFAFRLHQFLSSGSSVYATLEGLDKRQFRMESQYKLDDDRLLFPLSFCRECGQDYYLVNRSETGIISPRIPMRAVSEDSDASEAGYFAIEDGDLWDENAELPDSWLTAAKRPRVRKNYLNYVPQRLRLTPDGKQGVTNTVEGWYQPQKLRLCLRCRAVYDGRQSEYTKLSPLTQTGRSTATTVATSAGVSDMMAQGVERTDAKVLSFTDNRQDASLQAGHLNDFAQTAQVRAGLVAALNRMGELGFEQVGDEIFSALNLEPAEFMAEPVDSGPGWQQGKRAMIRALQCRALEDLSRGWRIVQPNLEQVGLLTIRYLGLSELASDDSRWASIPRMDAASPETRTRVMTALLDYLRMQLAIEAPALSEEGVRQMQDITSGRLREPWGIEREDRVAQQKMALLPGKRASNREAYFSFSLGSRSAINRYLRNGRTWGGGVQLTSDQGEQVTVGILDTLKGHILTVVKNRKGEERGVRILADSIRWALGDGKPLAPDPVRSRDLHLRREMGEKEPNPYFASLYRNKDGRLNHMLAREHTGQVSIGDRRDREKNFRAGSLPLLFCSPTMELGVDISELQMVHMRNIPPTPANYAQRSGRAGRGGEAALIAAFAANGNAHDQRYFRRRNEMIAGAVVPARMDMLNRELLESHIHALWLAEAAIGMRQSIREVLNLESGENYPMRDEIRAKLDVVNLNKVRSAAYEILGRIPGLQSRQWYSPEWLEDLISGSVEAFDRAFDYWRELYAETCAARDKAYRDSTSPSSKASERKEAERRQMRANREVNLLLNDTHFYGDSDFYPYRYLATQGFLPGYNFTRLPVRALVPRSRTDDTDSIDRPRFLGLIEFGPRNVLYHEGRKHRVREIVMPVDGIESRMISAKICVACAYIHDGSAVSAEKCENCSRDLSGDNLGYPQRLLDMPTSRAYSTERISSEEEERVRGGYKVSTHYRFQNPDEQVVAQVFSDSGDTLTNLTYAPSTSVWRINQGWRGLFTTPFTLNPNNGRWLTPTQVEDAFKNAEQRDEQPPIDGIMPYVRVTVNIILIRPADHGKKHEQFLVTLAHALRRGIQLEYQVEESELEVEIVGDAHQQILLCESAEGGIGIGERLIDEPQSLAQIARRALEVCHYDIQNGRKKDLYSAEQCAGACYECLMSYANQREHAALDRNLVSDFLFSLATSKIERASPSESRQSSVP